MAKLILSTMLVLSGIQAFAAGGPLADDGFLAGQFVAIKGYETGANGITFQVPSQGCTDAKSFKVHVTHDQGGTGVALVRVNPDYCNQYTPYGTKISYSYSSIGVAAGEKFHVLNPNDSVSASEFQIK